MEIADEYLLVGHQAFPDSNAIHLSAFSSGLFIQVKTVF